MKSVTGGGAKAPRSPSWDTIGESVEAAVRTVDADSRARTHLANERTFLAWLRTGLSLVALGIAVAHFLEPQEGQGLGFAVILGVILVASGMLVTAAGGRRFIQARDQIEAETYRPDAPAVILSVFLVAVAGVASLAYIVWFG